MKSNKMKNWVWWWHVHKVTPVRLHPIAVSSDLQLNLSTPVADPDVQIKGEGAGAGAGGHPDPEIRGGGGAVSQKSFFGPSNLSLV